MWAQEIKGSLIYAWPGKGRLNRNGNIEGKAQLAMHLDDIESNRCFMIESREQNKTQLVRWLLAVRGEGGWTLAKTD